MNDQEKNSLSDRVAALEATVEKLRAEISRLTSEGARAVPKVPIDQQQPSQPQATFVKKKPPVAPPAPAAPRPAPQTPEVIRPKPKEKSFELPAHMRRMEYWLNKAGIGLVLFAIVFLFKYSIDQGWLTPPIRQ